MKFSITDYSQTPPVNKQLSIQLSQRNVPTINNNTDYLFHVFNSEYVDENIKQRDYTPDGDIDGYILGKINIDLTEDRNREIKIKEEIKEKEKAIDSIIFAAQKELCDNGIRLNQTEYSLISKDKLRNKQQVTCDKSFNEIIAQLQILKNLPDNIPDVAMLTFTADTSILDDVEALLKTEFPKSDWDEKFVDQIMSKRSFIIQGLEFIGDEGKICPFCDQVIKIDALDLIRRYKEFLNDNEAHILSTIDNLAQKINSIITSIKELANAINSAIADIDELKKYFPSLANIYLNKVIVTDEELISLFTIVEALRKKGTNIKATDFYIEKAIKDSKKCIEFAKYALNKNSQLILKVNGIKNNSNTERLTLRRNLCIAQYIQLKDHLKEQFEAISAQNAELEKLSNEIIKKEEQARVSKKRKVFETLEFFLNRFFAGKYTVDESTFQIKFQNMAQPKASSVLSDGEKSIVAFCFYLASTHLLIERINDYNKLFFIIDDPVSSIDFNFVYAIAQLLRDIKGYFGIDDHRYRFFVFTHNLEFYSIIIRNHIISQAYVMTPGKIERLKKQLLMPYERHLYDIVNIERGREMPSHTTGNSIRHVLETICKFEYPERNLDKFIAEIGMLKDNYCVFTLCQDLSHGAIRVQPPFDVQVLIEACKVIVAFMQIRYPGQIDAINIGIKS
jgi:hypothetical protein